MPRPGPEGPFDFTSPETGFEGGAFTLDASSPGERLVSEPSDEPQRVLLVRAGEHTCAIPLQHVSETMRPLPIEPLAGTADFVRGVSIIRGLPTPVVDLEGVLGGGSASGSYDRFVTVNAGARRAALGVQAVLGVRELGALGELPPLLRDSRSDRIETLGTLDARLLVVLRGCKLVPDEAWQKLTSVEQAR